MVMSDFLEEKGSQKKKFMMKMVPEKSKPLHNFSLPTSLRWGNQRFLRCMKVDSNGEIVSSDRRSSGSDVDSDGKDLKFVKQRSLKNLPSPSKNRASSSGVKSKIGKDGDDGIEEFRAKLMVHLQTAAEKMQYSIPEEKEDESVVASAVRPWNLRTRRAACKAPIETGGGSSKLDERQQQQQQNTSPQRNDNPSPKSLRLRELAATVANQGSEKKERRKFSISLTRGEIKEDFLRITGNNPCRRPKKRSKIIQKQLDNLFPALWLTEVTTDSYRVPDEVVETKKK
ncbi:hypothetical protein AQUCO_04100025v1 [Aquilegia coerulea]|uniref:DUF1639 domain-containing protein n=1 Tax=Aquilegia coerulea TaxID=218851 RepID=A0A2G5CPU1_AQUCA|nr:hypothetical protein AQUCO_04100025v1 [Aquilegia coerulea]